MPGGPLYIPDQVLRAINAHIDAAIARAESGYRSAQEEEDAVTGALFGALRIENQLVGVPQGDPPGVWRWGIEYSKLRSKGRDATEGLIGADGILQLRVSGTTGEQQKSALFQAKNTLRRDPKLVEQAAKLSTWREAAFAIGFAPGQYSAYALDEVLLSGGTLSRAHGQSLSSFIRNEFIPCHVGHPALYYDIDERKLYWAVRPATPESGWEYQWVSADFRSKHLVRINVRQPHIGPSRAEKVEIDQISRNRLTVTPQELFGLQGQLTIAKLRTRRAELLRVYHADRHHHLETELRAQLDARVIEINEAYHELRREIDKARVGTGIRRRPTSKPALKESRSTSPFVMKQSGERAPAPGKRTRKH